MRCLASLSAARFFLQVRLPEGSYPYWMRSIMWAPMSEIRCGREAIVRKGGGGWQGEKWESGKCEEDFGVWPFLVHPLYKIRLDSASKA